MGIWDNYVDHPHYGLTLGKQWVNNGIHSMVYFMPIYGYIMVYTLRNLFFFLKQVNNGMIMGVFSMVNNGSIIG